MNELENKKISNLLEEYPFVESYFEENKLDVAGFEDMTFNQYLEHFSFEEIEDLALDLNKLAIDLVEYIKQMKEFLGIEDSNGVDVLTILPGQNKSGEREGFDRLDIKKSEMIAIVGPTGSGKSRLLADIEWTAQDDTPTKRTILINGEYPDKKWRFSSNNRLVAQLSQNMNFVMDLSVKEFLELHARSRMVDDIESVVDKILIEANKLAGEQFRVDTQITALSGGQSRALMIADTAILSSSPIVLIDEIENAGIDRKKALDLLVSSDKIVLMATHDPTLALLADRRIIISNGGIADIIETSQTEKGKLKELEEMDQKIQEMRRALRFGERLQ
ncbi:MAG: ATP-binding cassette domain-containing protein [Peptostreptococcus sp.]|jgi:ABC-type lipoprotein export system ATPase subunit|uniref:ATP-binding cassette domain-containing protein n=1 Tax=Peptostreptococcus TaxID=1257 RepID=UPI000767AF21|nr:MULTISPECIES: ATP-binding cassette domain-containing protein [Peptostreptococcus]KXB71484.1 ABC transporter, ATP-binding protein [Peptostreptococcus anaerobius]MDU0964438.1 ATP-binding cassette domain-containing protein [Peptostreptococcus anaerobius]MDU0997889.1 ATP-binding cassette domain-containing protein [Peptostreptococcus anaerobius]MDU1174931.1 ATP-binding cassette domain-containing protein [Peptostreptococcus anaerobius]MDU1233212.1 ATP-binding cassette domain-containing protein [P